jgi:hypothetical protein
MVYLVLHEGLLELELIGFDEETSRHVTHFFSKHSNLPSGGFFTQSYRCVK